MAKKLFDYFVDVKNKMARATESFLAAMKAGPLHSTVIMAESKGSGSIKSATIAIIGDRPRFPISNEPCPSHEGQGFFHKRLADVHNQRGQGQSDHGFLFQTNPAFLTRGGFFPQGPETKTKELQ